MGTAILHFEMYASVQVSVTKTEWQYKK